jgi:hypothetical protein
LSHELTPFDSRVSEAVSRRQSGGTGCAHLQG